MLLTTIVTAPPPARAEKAVPDPAAICDQAARLAADATDVPFAVLHDLAHGTGTSARRTNLRPWPWTVTVNGDSLWFDREAQAQVHLFRRLREGARAVEIGCFQVNYLRHGQRFASIEMMFDPVEAALVAARLLAGDFARTGDWGLAVQSFRGDAGIAADPPPAAARYRASAFPLPPARPDPTGNPAAETGATASLMPLSPGRAGQLLDLGTGG